MAKLEAAITPLQRPLAARSGRLAVSATAAMLHEAERLRAQGRDLVDLGVGEPDFVTPEHITAAGMAALRDHFTRYTAIGGIASLKDAVTQAHRRDFGTAYRPEEVLVTVGGKQALFNATSVLVDHGDEVILPAPYWVSFYDQIRYAGGKPMLIETAAAEGFVLDLERVAAAITPRTKAILLNSPANPSGAVFPPEVVRGVLELCRRHGLWLISDECYARFVYDAKPHSVGAEPEARDFVVLAGSLSKTYAMTGWRMGYALAPVPIIQAMLKLQSHSTSNATSFVQVAAIAALTGTQEPVARMLAEYKERRALIVEGLRAIPGVRCVLPEGAFYAYPNIAALLGGRGPATAMEFSQRLLAETGVVAVPGEAFGGQGHIRFSYATSRAAIGEGLRRLAEFCALLK